MTHLYENWKHRLPKLAELFVKWKYPSSPTSAVPSTPPQSQHAPTSEYNFSVRVIDLYTLDQTVQGHQLDDEDVPEALMRMGYLAATPERPSLAFSLKTLELFRCIRLFKPSFSAEAFIKMTSHYYIVRQPASELYTC